MEENNNEKISVSGADLLKDVVADEKAAKTAPKDTEKDKKDKDKNKKKFKSNRKDRTCYNKSFILHQHLFCRSWRQQISNRNNKLNK